MSWMGEVACEGFQKSVLEKLRERREECLAAADREHSAQNYTLEMEHRHWASALSDAILIVEKEEL